MIGMAYAHRHPERISRLVILNTAAFHLPQGKPFPLVLRICRDTRIGALLVRGFNAFSLAASYVGCKRNPLSAELRRLYRLPYDSWAHRIATLRFVQDIPLNPGDRNYELISDVASGLRRFSAVPMLCCWGELDFVFDVTFLKEWMERFPDAEVHCYPDCGHYVLEDAGDGIIDLITGYLKRTDRTPAPD
jgi:haloalkane dehalogenase